ncbi:MAG TPA: Hsp20/alpha crystallin family protein [Gemmataceae bacterium]|nr:Hsp20/alpha crystallin family protein [Gemmataceae bacterium]
MFDELVYRRWSLRPHELWQAPVEVHETQEAYLIEIVLPDVPPTQVRFVVTERLLRIYHQWQARTMQGTEHRSETSQQEVAFSQPIDPERVRASYQHGTYRLNIPKKKSLAPTKPIEMQIEWEVRVTSMIEGGGNA